LVRRGNAFKRRPPRYKPTTAKYVGKTKTIYVSYTQTWMHNYRGRKKPRTQVRVKRVYVSGRLVRVEGPAYFTNRRGRRVYGLRITYLNPVRGGVWHRGGKTYRVGRKYVAVRKVVALPKDAKNVRVYEKLPSKLKGPLMDVA